MTLLSALTLKTPEMFAGLCLDYHPLMAAAFIWVKLCFYGFLNSSLVLLVPESLLKYHYSIICFKCK